MNSWFSQRIEPMPGCHKFTARRAVSDLWFPGVELPRGARQFISEFPNPFQRPMGGSKARHTLTLQPDGTAGIDTYMSEGGPDTNFGTATAISLRAGAGAQIRGLLKFSPTLPAGCTLVSAILTLTLNATVTVAGTVSIYRILAANSAWTEGAGTWNYQDGAGGGHRWAGDAASNGGTDAGCSVSGTDYSATLMGSFLTVLNDTAGTAYSASLNLTEFAALVAANYGLVLSTTATTSTNFRSSDHATAGDRPKLVIVYDA